MVKLIIADASGRKSRSETVSAKQAVYDAVGPQPRGTPFLESFAICAIHDPGFERNCIIDAGHSFYLSTKQRLIGFTVFGMGILWTEAYVEIRGEKQALATAINQFESTFNPESLNREGLKRNKNRIDLRSACPQYFFQDAPAPGGLVVNPIVETVDVENDIMHLAIRNPEARTRAEIWLTLSGRKVTKSRVDVSLARPPRPSRLSSRKVIESPVDEQEMDLIEGGFYAKPKKNCILAAVVRKNEPKIIAVCAILVGGIAPLSVVTFLLTRGRWILAILSNFPSSSRIFHLASCIRALAFIVCPAMGALLIVTGLFVLHMEGGHRDSRRG
jgi:hypothetical protein